MPPSTWEAAWLRGTDSLSSESRGVRWVKEKHAGIVSVASRVSASRGQIDESGQQPVIPNHSDLAHLPRALTLYFSFHTQTQAGYQELSI